MVHPDPKYRNKMILFPSVAENKQFGRVSYLRDEDKALFKQYLDDVQPPGGCATVPAGGERLDRITQADVFIDPRRPRPCRRPLLPSFVWMPFHFKPMEQRVVRALGCFDVHVAMTHYGEMICNDYFGPCSPAAESSKGEAVTQIEYAPHGRPTDIFCAIPGLFSDDADEREAAMQRRTAIRKELGWPEDAFVCLIVASNSEASNRKALDAAIQAWSRFATGLEIRDEGSSWLHIHSGLDGATDILRVLEMVGEIDDRTRWTDPKDTCGKSKLTKENQTRLIGRRVSAALKSDLHSTPDADMAKMYQAADTLICSSCAEGFGVPIIEAQLCGCPVVANKTTAMCAIYIGACVRPSYWIARNDFNAGWDQPSASGLVRGLRKVAMWDPEERARRIRKHYEYMREEYSPEAVGREWLRVVEDVVARRGADGRIAGFPSARNHQLSMGRMAKEFFLRRLACVKSVRGPQVQLEINKEREEEAERFELLCA